MAITKTDLTSGFHASSYVTASVSPGANRLVLIAVWSRGDDTNPTGIAGAGLTFDMILAQDPSSGSRQMSLWRAMSASPSSGAITITFSGAQTTVSWSVMEFDGVDTGGSNGSAAVVQSAGNTDGSGTATSLSVTLAAFGDAANNVAFGFVGIRAVNENMNPGSGFAEIHEVQDSGDGTIITEWKTGEDTGVDASWSTGADVGGIAIEIAAGGGGGGGERRFFLKGH